MLVTVSRIICELSSVYTIRATTLPAETLIHWETHAVHS